MRGASVTGRAGWCHTELGVLGGYWPTRDGDRPGCSPGLTASRSGSVVCPTDWPPATAPAGRNGGIVGSSPDSRRRSGGL